MINSGGKAHPVAGLIPNDLYLFDTLGNRHEWCERLWGGKFVVDPRGGYYFSAAPERIDIDTAVEKPIKDLGFLDSPTRNCFGS
jgi:hypothetical protein